MLPDNMRFNIKEEYSLSDIFRSAYSKKGDIAFYDITGMNA